MLYPTPGIDDFKEDECISGDDEEDLNIKKKLPENKISKPKKKKKKLTSQAEIVEDAVGEISSNFHFEVDEGIEEEDNKQNDLEGLTTFLKKNQNRMSTLAEKIEMERKRIGQKSNIDALMEIGEDTFKDEKETESTPFTMELTENEIKNDKLRLKQLGSKQFFEKSSDQLEQKVSSFDELNLSRPILKAILECGFQLPTPIQAACIPVALAGRDICACSATGTGKTAAFMLPIFERLLYKPQGKRPTTRVLVLVPTRELAIQVFQVSKRLAKYTSVEMCLVAGGLDVRAQEAALRMGLDVVIATPGRLIDHLHNSPNFSLLDIEVLVLDEADRMLEEQFMEQLSEIIKLCARNRQTMLFSATLSEAVEDLARLSLDKPIKLFVNENTDVALNLRQEFVRIRGGNEEENSLREAMVAALVARNFSERTIIFVRTKHECERLCILLALMGLKTGQLHGGLNQVQRVQALHSFRKQTDVKILCATDLAARGLDIEGVMTVINMHMPNTIKNYIHRVGRTARAGKTGRAISMIGENDRKLAKEILKEKTTNSSNIIQRSIPPEIINLFLKQIKQLESSIEKLIEDEKIEKMILQKQEKPIVKTEEGNVVNKLVKRGIKEKKKYFKSDKWLKGGKKQIDLKNKRPTKSKGRKREEKKNAKYEEALKGNKSEKINLNLKAKGKREKSSFTSEIADISKLAIKRHRRGPDDADFRKIRKERRKSGNEKRK
uniref:RNA helicase n=1 Tax=Meloidogyne incognita TaxID=6306 RepID=A0A914KQ93_MELIC